MMIVMMDYRSTCKFSSVHSCFNCPEYISHVLSQFHVITVYFVSHVSITMMTILMTIMLEIMRMKIMRMMMLLLLLMIIMVIILCLCLELI